MHNVCPRLWHEMRNGVKNIRGQTYRNNLYVVLTYCLYVHHTRARLLDIQKHNRNSRSQFFLCTNQSSIWTNLMGSISRDELSLTGCVVMVDGDPMPSFCLPQPDPGIPILIIAKGVVPRQVLQSTRTNPFVVVVKLPECHYPLSSSRRTIPQQQQQQQWLCRCILEFAEAECWRRQYLPSQSTMSHRSKL